MQDHPQAAGSIATRTLRLLRPYWNYLPTILLGWLLVEMVGGAVPEGHRWTVQGFFLCFVLVATGAGVASSAQITGVGFWRTSSHRLSVIGEFLYVAVLAFLAVLVYVALAVPFDPGLDHRWHRLAHDTASGDPTAPDDPLVPGVGRGGGAGHRRHPIGRRDRSQPRAVSNRPPRPGCIQLGSDRAHARPP